MDNTRRLLTRNTREGKVGGVAAGIGDYLDIDPVLVRLAFVLLLFAGGAGLLLYLVAWLIIPAGDVGAARPAAPAAPRSHERSGRWLLGAVLVAFGIILFVVLGGGPWWLDPDVFLEAEILWPLLLVAAGGALLVWRRDRGSGGGPNDATPGGSAPDAEPPAGPGPVDGPVAADAPVAPTVEADPAAPSDAAEDASEQPTQPSAAAFAADPTSELTTETTSEYPTFEELASPYPPPSGPVPISSPVVPDRLPEPLARRRRLPVGWITLGAILAAAATAALLDVTGALAVPVEWLLVIALGLSGIGIVVAAWYGRVRGPVALAVLSGLALMAVSVVEVPLRGGIGEQTVQPSSIDELGSEYHLGVGKLVLDLRQLSLSQPVGRVEAGVSVGELVVLLPPNAIAQVDGRASVGKVELFDRERAGVHVDESYPGPAVAGQPALLTLDLEVGVGRVEARTEATPPPGSSF